MKNLKNQADCFSTVNKILLKKTNFNNNSLKFYSITDKKPKISVTNTITHHKIESAPRTENKIFSINKKHIFGLFKQSPKVEEKPKAEKEPESQPNKGKNFN